MLKIMIKVDLLDPDCGCLFMVNVLKFLSLKYDFGTIVLYRELEWLFNITQLG